MCGLVYGTQDVYFFVIATCLLFKVCVWVDSYTSHGWVAVWHTRLLLLLLLVIFLLLLVKVFVWVDGYTSHGWVAVWHTRLPLVKGGQLCPLVAHWLYTMCSTHIYHVFSDPCSHFYLLPTLPCSSPLPLHTYIMFSLTLDQLPSDKILGRQLGMRNANIC